MIDQSSLRYLMSYSSLIRESVDYEIKAKVALAKGDEGTFNYLMLEAQRSMDESTRRLEVQHGTDHGQRQKTWMSAYNQLTPLL